jgi:hypothetical protein
MALSTHSNPRETSLDIDEVHLLQEPEPGTLELGTMPAGLRTGTDTYIISSPGNNPEALGSGEDNLTIENLDSMTFADLQSLREELNQRTKVADFKCQILEVYQRL